MTFAIIYYFKYSPEHQESSFENPAKKFSTENCENFAPEVQKNVIIFFSKKVLEIFF